MTLKMTLAHNRLFITDSIGFITNEFFHFNFDIPNLTVCYFEYLEWRMTFELKILWKIWFFGTIWFLEQFSRTKHSKKRIIKSNVSKANERFSKREKNHSKAINKKNNKITSRNDINVWINNKNISTSQKNRT